MNIDYLISQKTNGANPFKILNFVYTLAEPDQNTLAFAIKRMPYGTFLKTAYWFAISMEARSKAGMRCQVCNSINGISVHHRTYDTHGYEHKHMNDLVVLCESCHGLFHGHKTSAPLPNGKIKLPRNFVMPHEPSDTAIPDGDSFVLTHELINDCRANGSFTNATLRAFGMSKATMQSGWVDRLVGKVLARSDYQKAKEGRFIYKSGPLK